MAAYRIGFIIEQVLGHITHTRNLQDHLRDHSEIAAYWGLIPYPVSGLAGRVPVYKSNWTVRAGLRARRLLARIAAAQSLDVLFFHTHVPALLALDWLRRLPSVISLDATPLQFDRLGQFYQHAQGPAWLETLKWRLNYACYQAAGHIVTWSDWAKQGLIADYNVPAEKITVIPPGVSVAHWQRPTPRSLHSGPVKLLFVGADLERKGGLLLIEAFRNIRAQADVELHLVTRDSVAVEPGMFVYHQLQPNSPELKALYHECDIFVLPTYGDCLPMVLSEAGAAGMATIATDVAAIPEIVRANETGLTIPAGDGAALEDRLRLLIGQPHLRLRLGERAVAHIGSAYDARANVARLLELLKQQADTAHLKLRAAV